MPVSVYVDKVEDFGLHHGSGKGECHGARDERFDRQVVFEVVAHLLVVGVFRVIEESHVVGDERRNFHVLFPRDNGRFVAG